MATRPRLPLPLLLAIVLAPSARPDGVASASARLQLGRKAGAAAAVSGLAFDHQGKRLLVALADGRVEVVETATLETTRELRGSPPSSPGKPVKAFFTADGSRIVTFAKGAAPQVWDPASGQLFGSMAPAGIAEDMDVNPRDPGEVAISGGRSDVEFWDPRTLKKKRALGIKAMTFKWRGSTCVYVPTKYGATVFHLAYAPDASCLAVDQGDRVQRVPLPGGKVELADESRWGFSSRWPTDRIPAGQTPWNLWRGAWYDAATANIMGFDEAGFSNTTYALAASAPARGLVYAATGTDPNVHRVLPATGWGGGGARMVPVEGLVLAVSALAVSGDGAWLAVGCRDGSLTLASLADPDHPKVRRASGATVALFDALAAEYLVHAEGNGVTFDGVRAPKTPIAFGVFREAKGRTVLGLQYGSSPTLDMVLTDQDLASVVPSTAPFEKVELPSIWAGSKDAYLGQLAAGQPEGFGILISPGSHSVRIGFFRKGRPQGRGCLLIRIPMANPVMHGSTTRLTDRLWVGDWEDGDLRQGRYYLDLVGYGGGAEEQLGEAQVLAYRGEFVNLDPDGQGQGTSKSDILEGTFVKGRFVAGTKTALWGGAVSRVDASGSKLVALPFHSLYPGRVLVVGGKTVCVRERSKNALDSWVDLDDGTRIRSGTAYSLGDEASAEGKAALGRYRAWQATKAAEAQAAAAARAETVRNSGWSMGTIGSGFGSSTPSYMNTQTYKDQAARDDLKRWGQYLDYKIFGKPTGVTSY